MSYVYVVKPGDCLWSIAKREGFSHWRPIYDHPENAAYRAKRPDPNVLYPGDRLFIPNRGEKWHSCETGARHTFRKKIVPAFLFLVIEDDEGNPIDGSYTLDVEGQTSSAELIAGEVRAEIPADAESAFLSILPEGSPPGSEWTWHVRLGHLDPVDELSGVQCRLTNLGFDCGLLGATAGPLTESAVTEFQKTAFTDEREWDGIPGPKTQRELAKHHRV